MRPLLAAAVLAATGATAAVLAPIFLNPYSNLGPLQAYYSAPLFIVLGAVAGLALGGLANTRQWSGATFGGFITLAIAIIAGAILFISLPDDLWKADLIRGDVVSCARPSDFQDDVIEQWRRSIAINPQYRLAANWPDDVRATLAASSERVVEVQVESKRSVYEGRKPWNKGKLFLVDVKTPKVNERFILPERICASHLGQTQTYLARPADYDGFPARSAATLMNLMRLEPRHTR